MLLVGAVSLVCDKQEAEEERDEERVTGVACVFEDRADLREEAVEGVEEEEEEEAGGGA